MSQGRHKLLERQLRHIAILYPRLSDEDRESMDRFLSAVNDGYKTYDDDRAFIEHSMELSSTELFNASQKLKRQNLRLTDLQSTAEKLRYENELILNSVGEGILRVDLAGMVVFANPRALQMAGWEARELMGRSLHEALPHRKANGVACAKENCSIFGAFLDGYIRHVDTETFLRKDGTPFPVEYTSSPVRETGKVVGAVVVFKDIAKRLDLEKSFVQAAHQAGMAEIATGVIHNVGNILNSVNVSAENIQRIVDENKVGSLKKANALIQENMSAIGEFLTKDPRGSKLPGFYVSLEEAISSDFDKLRVESSELTRKIQLIKDVVNIQQNYAKGADFKEELSPQEIVENALLIQLESLLRYNIKIVKSLPTTRPVLAQKSKLIHILLNLIKNAKEAMADCEKNERILSLEVENGGDNHVVIRISDTGCGVAPENLNKIFTHGFTTKKDGHGFGLHHCANALTEMGGTIFACSDGVDRGTTFTIKLKSAA